LLGLNAKPISTAATEDPGRGRLVLSSTAGQGAGSRRWRWLGRRGVAVRGPVVAQSPFIRASLAAAISDTAPRRQPAPNDVVISSAS